jgi:hypothetical protein
LQDKQKFKNERRLPYQQLLISLVIKEEDPSLFDCNLASTYGFTAGVLIKNKFTGLVTSARCLTA